LGGTVNFFSEITSVARIFCQCTHDLHFSKLPTDGRGSRFIQVWLNDLPKDGGQENTGGLSHFLNTITHLFSKIIQPYYAIQNMFQQMA
jgi:hypothetical protein